jgi:hypothetical protein
MWVAFKTQHRKEIDMTLTSMQSRCPQRSSSPATVKVRPLAPRSAPLVPEVRVKEMLREIAFVLQITRRLSKEIRESTAQAEDVHA